MTTQDEYNSYVKNIANAKRAREARKDHKVEGDGASTVLEPRSLVRTLATPQVQEGAANRVVVRITSVRRRLIDEDNICEKFIIDGLRYAGLLLSDAPDKTHIQTSQRKCKKEEFEHTEIEIEKL